MKSKLAKAFGITRAFVSYNSSGDYYTQPEIFLKGDDSDSTLVRLTFQAHRVDRADPLGSTIGNSPSAFASERFDFGAAAYSHCYAARVADASSGNLGSLNAEPGRRAGCGFRKLASLMDKVDHTVTTFNLRHVVKNGCDLTLWVEALEKLGVSVQIRRFVGGRELDYMGWRFDLLEGQRHPARDLAEARANGSRPADS